MLFFVLFFLIYGCKDFFQESKISKSISNFLPSRRLQRNKKLILNLILLRKRHKISGDDIEFSVNSTYLDFLKYNPKRNKWAKNNQFKVIQFIWTYTNEGKYIYYIYGWLPLCICSKVSNVVENKKCKR